MSILLVGGDRLDSITKKLREVGFNKIDHISGRKAGDRRSKIPKKTDLVLVLVDFVEHELTETIKKESRRSNTKILFCRRSWVHMENNIQECIKEIESANR
jgi:hypothetical protein